jgi:hypothetical protein
MGNVPNKSCRENQNTHFMPSDLFPKIVPVTRYVEKCGGVREAADDNTAARWMVD